LFYEYYCQNCMYEEEVEHSIIQDPEIKCRKCGSKMQRKITGGVGVHYKGVGWPRKGTGTHAPIQKITEEKVVVHYPKK